jgi:hypothetical protein
MSPLTIATISFGCILLGALIGTVAGTRLPDHHLASDSKDVVKTAMAMVATMTALLLGLVTASAKSTFDDEDAAIKSTAAGLLSLDRMLADYGPETQRIRDSIRSLVAAKMAQVWPEDSPRAVDLGKTPANPGELIVGQMLSLTPQSSAQEWYKARALDLGTQLLQARWIVFGNTQTTVPSLFLIVVISWLTVLFGSFGLFAPRNGTVFAALLICILSVSASIFLVLEMDNPFDGMMKVSSDPLRYAVAHMGQ